MFRAPFPGDPHGRADVPRRRSRCGVSGGGRSAQQYQPRFSGSAGCPGIGYRPADRTRSDGPDPADPLSTLGRCAPGHTNGLRPTALDSPDRHRTARARGVSPALFFCPEHRPAGGGGPAPNPGRPRPEAGPRPDAPPPRLRSPPPAHPPSPPAAGARTNPADLPGAATDIGMCVPAASSTPAASGG